MVQNYLVISRCHNHYLYSCEIIEEKICLEKLIKECKLSLEEAKEKLTDVNKDIYCKIFTQKNYYFIQQYNNDGRWVALLDDYGDIFVKVFTSEKAAYKFLRNCIEAIIYKADVLINPSIFNFDDKEFVKRIKELTDEKDFRVGSEIYYVDVYRLNYDITYGERS